MLGAEPGKRHQHNHKPNVEHRWAKLLTETSPGHAQMPFSFCNHNLWVGFYPSDGQRVVPPSEVQCCATSARRAFLGTIHHKHTAGSTFPYNSISQAMLNFISVKLNKIQAFWKSTGALPLVVVGMGWGSCSLREMGSPISSQFLLLKLIFHALTMKICKELYSFPSSLNPVHIFPG